MRELEETLIRCFAAVFPNLSREEIPTASVDSVAEWDSLAALTLVAVVEEQFELEIDELDLPELSSFAALHAHLQERVLSRS
jgi:acyl carrier protein